MKKKKLNRLLALLLTAAMVSGLAAGCGNKSEGQTSSSEPASEKEDTESADSGQEPDGEVVELDFWHTLTGDDGTVLGTMVEDFNKEYEDQIHIKVQAMESSDFSVKVPMSIEAGEGIPDLTVLSVGDVMEYSQQGLLLEMDDEMMADMELSEEQFAPKMWDAGNMPDGKRYSIPIDAHAMLMYYNEDILKELGYKPEELNELSKDKFMEMCTKAKDAGYTGVSVWWGWMDFMFCSYLNQNGGELVSAEDPTEPLYNTELGAESVDYFKGLYDAGVTNGLDVHPDTIFQQGTTLFALTGTWVVSGMNAIDGLNWGLAPLPMFGENGEIWAGSHNLSIFKKELDDEHRDAITTFIKWFSDHGTEWAQSGSVPARMDVLESDDYKALSWSFAADEIDKFTFAPPVLTAGSVKSGLDGYIYDYYLGNIPSAEEALQQAYEDGKAKAKETLESMDIKE